jgi:hypothetical protein
MTVDIECNVIGAHYLLSLISTGSSLLDAPKRLGEKHPLLLRSPLSLIRRSGEPLTPRFSAATTQQPQSQVITLECVGTLGPADDVLGFHTALAPSRV